MCCTGQLFFSSYILSARQSPRSLSSGSGGVFFCLEGDNPEKLAAPLVYVVPPCGGGQIKKPISCESIYAKVTTVPVLPSSASMALIKSVSEKQTAKCSPFLRLWSASFSASSSEFGLSSIKQFTCGCARYSYNPAASFFQNH